MNKKDSNKNDSKFDKYQKKWNEDNVEIERFKWQTTNKIIVQKEKKLLKIIKKNIHKRILEVGCGEGANSYNLEIKKNNFIGCDYSRTRIDFAKKNSPGKFIVSDGTKLIFKNDSFDIVFCRDVIHHLRDRNKFLSEMYRVCKPGGSVILLESNALHPINIGFSLLYKKERDMRQITPRHVNNLLSKFPGKIHFDYSEAYNVDRILFHYRLGFPKLAENKIIRKINNIVNSVFDFMIPKIFRAYMIVELKKSSTKKNKNLNDKAIVK